MTALNTRLLSLLAAALVFGLTVGGGFAAGLIWSALHAPRCGRRDLLLRLMAVRAARSGRYLLALRISAEVARLQVRSGRAYLSRIVASA